MSSGTQRGIAGVALGVMVALFVVGAVSHVHDLLLVGVIIGAIPAFARTFVRWKDRGSVPPQSPDGSRVGIAGNRVRPARPVGQAAVDNPPDTAPVAEKLKAWRRK
jgi:hypothetical protein